MMKFKKRISNPMTVIAIFAALSETSAAISLPFLDNNQREIYVWFLISFPFYLLFLFFLTLNLNYRSLYAPSDFEKEKNFVKVIDNTVRSDSKKQPCAKDSPVKLNESMTTPTSERSLPGLSAQLYRAWKPRRPPSQANCWVQHNVLFSAHMKDLSIIDARKMTAKADITTLLDKIREPREPATKVVVFLAYSESERLLKESTHKYSKHRKKGACPTFWIVYNLNSQGVTVLDEA
jgi:hypothetical protein